MSTATESIERPANVSTVARRYWRVTGVLRVALILCLVAVVVLAAVTLPVAQLLGVGIAVILLIRVPVLKADRTITLTTEKSPSTVHQEFRSLTPPLLAVQWCLADEIRSTDTGGEYDLSSMLGIKTATLTVESRSVDTADDRIELVVTTNGNPWSTYRVSTRSTDGGTEVTVSVIADRRFGIRRLPDWVAGRYYAPRLFAEQGYTVVDRSNTLSL